MPPKRNKPGPALPKGCEVVSVSDVEAGVNNHAYKSGSGKSGSNLTEKDKVDFLCLLRQMSGSSEGNGNRSNPGMQSSANTHIQQDVTLSHTDIIGWSQPSTANKTPSAESSPEWEYLNFQDLLNARPNDPKASQRSEGLDIKNPWSDGPHSETSENPALKGTDTMLPQTFPKPSEMTWPAPPGLQQTKFVRQPMAQPQFPMPNFPHAQQPQLPMTQGVLPQAQTPFNLSLPQHPLGINLPQHQFTQPQLIPHCLPHTPDSPLLMSPPSINPNSSEIAQSGRFMTHPGMAQPWPPSPLLPGQAQQNPIQHSMQITAKQPFLPVRPVVSGRTVTVNQQDLQFRHQHMQQPFSPQPQVGVEQPWPIKEMLSSTQTLPPGLIPNQLKQDNIGSGRSDMRQPRPLAPNSAQTQEEIHKLLGALALKTGLQTNSTTLQQTTANSIQQPISIGVQQPNSTAVQQPNPTAASQPASASVQHPNAPVVQQPNAAGANKAVKKGQRDARNVKPLKMNGAEPPAGVNISPQIMEILKLALNCIDIRNDRPHCVPCQKMMREEDMIPHLKNRNHRDMIEVHNIRVTCSDLPNRREFFHVLTKLLEEQYDSLRITDAQMTQVNAIVLQLNEMLKQCLESFAEEWKKQLCGAEIRLYGSLATGMALKGNVKLNLDLNLPNIPKEDSLKVFLQCVKMVEDSELFRDVKHVIADSYSAVTFTDVKTDLPVALSLNNHNPYRLGQLLAEYGKLDERVVKLCVLFRAWGKICQVDNADDSAFLPHAFPLLVVYFLQNRRLLPVLHEMVGNGKKYDANVYLDAESAAKMWRAKDVSIGELWVHLFHFYLFDHDVTRHVVCITQSYPFRRADTNWRARRIAIIDPFQPKRNVACHLSQVMSRYIDDCFIYTFLHYAIPQTSAGPAFGTIRKVPAWLYRTYPLVSHELYIISNLIKQIVFSTESYCPPRPENERLRASLRRQLEQRPVFKFLMGMQQREEIQLFPDIVIDETGLVGKEDKVFADWSVTIGDANEIFDRFNPERLCYRFDKATFTNDTKAPKWCKACSQVGHKRQDCPDEVMPVPDEMPPLSPSDIEVLNNLCDSVCEKWSASVDEITSRDGMKDELLQFIQEKFPDANLDIFGSSNNGFGSRQSDVDVCLTFANNPDGEGIDFSAMITRIGDMLRKHKEVSEVNAVSMAKVPIVKFVWKKNILVDLSLYNRLGQENTKLLKTYSEIDLRVRPLVYMMKRFVKTACIGDASRGSLSSYAYTLMVLYFLQQVEPPILPVLQELCESGDVPPKKELDNSNVYFYSDVSNLKKVWNHKKNEKTVGELWLDILDFYVSPKFHESNKVVSIRKLDPLYKVNKMWMSTNLCIEDPFDLAHNLGSGLSRRMSVHIVRCFLKARRHFGSPFPAEDSSPEEYYFDADKLMAGKPPCDRGCRLCGHIGHIRDECPERRGVAQEQQKPKKRQANGTDKGNQRNQGRKGPDNERSSPIAPSAPTANKRPSQSPDTRTKAADSVLPNVSNEKPAPSKPQADVAEAPGKKPPAADKAAKPKVPAKNSKEVKVKDKKMSSDNGSQPPPPKGAGSKEKTRTYRNSQRKGPAVEGAGSGAGQKVVNLNKEKTAAKDSGVSKRKGVVVEGAGSQVEKTAVKDLVVPNRKSVVAKGGELKAGEEKTTAKDSAPSTSTKASDNRKPRKRKPQQERKGSGPSPSVSVPVTVIGGKTTNSC